MRHIVGNFRSTIKNNKKSLALRSCVPVLQINKKKEPLPEPEGGAKELNLNPCQREPTSCTIFLGFTSNMISCGVRDTLRFLCQHNLVRKVSSSASNQSCPTSIE